jgi:HEAT repeat protein
MIYTILGDVRYFSSCFTETKMSKKKTPTRHSAIPPVAATEQSAPTETSAAKTKLKATEALKSATATAQVETPAATTTPTKPVAHATSAVAVPAATPANPQLLAALRGSDADAARDAAASLGATGNASAVEPLIEVLNNSDGYFHSVVRAAAASSLAQLRDARAVEPLLNAIHDPMAETSAEAVRALATLGDRRAVAPLIDVLRNSDGFFLSIVRRAAVFALAKLGGEPALSELRAVASNDSEDSVIRQDARQATSQSADAR